MIDGILIAVVLILAGFGLFAMLFLWAVWRDISKAFVSRG